MSSTASDMANFMIAHLSGGAYSGGRILKEETIKEMHKQHFTYDPALGGMTLGFMEGVFNDKDVLFHGGSTMLYNTGGYSPIEYYRIIKKKAGKCNILVICVVNNHEIIMKEEFILIIELIMHIQISK